MSVFSDGGGQLAETAAAQAGGRGDADAAGRDLAPGPLQLLNEAGAAARFPLVDPTSSGGFHPIDERAPRDGGGVADPDAGQPGHQLPGAVFPDAEESLDPLAVQVACVHAAEHVQNFRKPVKPSGLGRHRAGFDSTPGQGAIRQYEIFGERGRGVVMNDKGHYHSY